MGGSGLSTRSAAAFSEVQKNIDSASGTRVNIPGQISNQLIHHRNCFYRLSRVDVVDVPIRYPVLPTRKPLRKYGPVLGFLQGNDKMRPIKISQRTWQRVASRSLRHDGLCLKSFKGKPRHRAYIVGRSLFSQSAGKCPPSQGFASCVEIEKLLCVPASIIVSGAKEKYLLAVHSG
jgi:hypothetical protein